MNLLTHLANATYGTPDALDLVEELLDDDCPLDRIDAAIKKMRELAGVEIEVEYDVPRFATRGWLGAVAEAHQENVR